ncbi:MAG: lipoyl protein ligase domain-containing protein, partial [Streptosporangiaceae bacterium]
MRCSCARSRPGAARRRCRSGNGRLNDITSSRGKIGGAAQKRLASAVLHHVTMAYDIDAEKMLRVL